MERILLLVDVTHTNLSEVSRMVLVEVDSVVMLSSSVSTTSGMLPVLSYTSVSSGDMSSQLTSLGGVGRHPIKSEGLVLKVGLKVNY